MYEIDTRLRPSGNAGPLVSSLEAFARYHAKRRTPDASPETIKLIGQDPTALPPLFLAHAADVWRRMRGGQAARAGVGNKESA